MAHSRQLPLFPPVDSVVPSSTLAALLEALVFCCLGLATSMKQEQKLSKMWAKGHRMGPATKGTPMTATMETMLNFSSKSDLTEHWMSRSLERTCELMREYPPDKTQMNPRAAFCLPPIPSDSSSKSLMSSSWNSMTLTCFVSFQADVRLSVLLIRPSQHKVTIVYGNTAQVALDVIVYTVQKAISKSHWEVATA